MENKENGKTDRKENPEEEQPGDKWEPEVRIGYQTAGGEDDSKNGPGTIRDIFTEKFHAVSG